MLHNLNNLRVFFISNWNLLEPKSFADKKLWEPLLLLEKFSIGTTADNCDGDE
jgi:hypothetical protein